MSSKHDDLVDNIVYFSPRPSMYPRPTVNCTEHEYPGLDHIKMQNSKCTKDENVVAKEEDTRTHESESFLKTTDEQNEAKEIKQQQPQKWKLKLFALYCIFLSLGVANSLTGPTMVDMEEFLGTDTSGMSIAMAVSSVGYLTGSAVCSVTYGRFLLEFQLLFVNVVMGTCLSLAPWPRSLAVFCMFIFLRGFCGGLIDSCGQGYVLFLTEGHRLRDPSMQFLHGIWSIGASVGPLIIKPFLRPDADDQLIGSNTTYVLNTSTLETTMTSSSFNLANLSSNGLLSPTTLGVGYAYLTVGSIVLALGIPMLCAYISGPLRIWVHKKNKDKQRKEDSQPRQPRKFRVVLLILVFFWFYFYLWAEMLPGAFMAPFVIKYLHWPRSNGPLISTTLWGSHGIGRLLAVVISAFATPRQMIISSMALTAAAYVIMLTFMNVHPAAVWISVGLAGLGMASSFGTMVLWISKYIRVEGTAGSVFLVGSSTGSMTGSILAGFLFQNVSPLCTIYLMLTGALMNVLLYVIMEIYVRFSQFANFSQSIINTETDHETNV